MSSDLKNEIKKINDLIEKHSLQKIMKIVYAGFGGLIVLTLVSNLMPTKYYDCSQQGTQVIDKVLACEQIKVDEKFKEKEMELEEYKISENYKMEKLKAVLSQIDLKDPKKLLNSLEESSSRIIARSNMDSCLDKAIKTMCEVKFK